MVPLVLLVHPDPPWSRFSVKFQKVLIRMVRSGPSGPRGPQPPLVHQEHSGPPWTKLRHFPEVWGWNPGDRYCPGTFNCSGGSQLVTRFHTRQHWPTPAWPNCGRTSELGICTQGVQLQISRPTVLQNHNTSVKDLELMKQMKRFIECPD